MISNKLDCLIGSIITDILATETVIDGDILDIIVIKLLDGREASIYTNSCDSFMKIEFE